MTARLLATTALTLGLLLPAVAMAQQQPANSPAMPTMENKTSPAMPTMENKTSPGATGTTTGTTGATTMSTLDKSVIGKSLYGANGEKVGKIDDVVMSQGGGVESILVDVGGFLGLGAKTIAVPADDVAMQGDKLVAGTLTKDQAEQMPEYKK